MAEITLLIPCYNAARFLPRLMEGVCQLTCPFSTILCYDDGSTDDTVTVARNLGLEIITGQPNRGVARARNELAAAACTEWIHFHDADDWIAPSFLERLGPQCSVAHDVVSCDADWVEDSTGAMLIRWRYNPAELAHDALSHLLANPMSLNNSIIRRTAWNEIGGCDESLTMWEDADVHIRLARSGARFHHASEVLTRSLRRGDSFSHDYRRSWVNRLNALEKYASDPGNDRIRSVLAAEAEKAAASLASLGEVVPARRAIALCRRLGGDPPTSRHPLMRALKPFLPVHVLLRWQSRQRHRAS